MKDIPEYTHFSGSVFYKTQIEIGKEIPEFINLGKVNDLAKLKINDVDVGIKWYGNRIFKVGHLLKEGKNVLEIEVVTLMGNYMKSLTENDNVQYWTNLKNKNQPLMPLGLLGPVSLY